MTVDIFLWLVICGWFFAFGYVCAIQKMDKEVAEAEASRALWQERADCFQNHLVRAIDALAISESGLEAEKGYNQNLIKQLREQRNANCELLKDRDYLRKCRIDLERALSQKVDIIAEGSRVNKRLVEMNSRLRDENFRLSPKRDDHGRFTKTT